MSEQLGSSEARSLVNDRAFVEQAQANDATEEKANEQLADEKIGVVSSHNNNVKEAEEEQDAQKETTEQAAALPSSSSTGVDTKNITDTSTTAQDKDPRSSWDFSNRRVLIEGVLKFWDVKSATKMVDQWLPNIPSSDNAPVVAYDKIKKPPKATWMVVQVKEVAMVQPLIDYINNNDDIRNKKGRKLVAKVATDMDSNGNNRKRNSAAARRDDSAADDDDDDAKNRSSSSKGSTKRQKRSDDDYVQKARRHVTATEVQNKITPLWEQSAQQQLDTKMKLMIKKCAIKIVQEIKAKFRQLGKERDRKRVDLYPWVAQQRGITVEPIVSAPTPLRNKCEFTFGYRYLEKEKEEDDEKANNGSTAMEEDEVASDGNNKSDSNEPPKVPAVGFMCMGWAGGVSHPQGLRNIPNEVCALVDVVDAFLSTSPLPPYDSKSHKGFWRLLTVRTSRRTQECMVIVQHTPAASGGKGEEEDASLDFTKAFETEKARLISVLSQAELPTAPDGPALKVTSIFFQEFDGLSSPPPEHPVQHAYGKLFLTEKLGKCIFQISPGSFFQVNTEGAEILYQIVVDKVKEVSKDDPENTLLFDVCCGTGTIGLTCLKEGAVGQVIGVDISEPAIEDAKKNAVLNGYETIKDGADNSETVDKTRFVAARAEQVLSQEIHKAKKRDMKFVAIVDPAREGLHADVVKTLRANERIERLVYVSCNPTASLIRDAALLCTPPTKKYTGRPFRVTSACPVDMFPLTNHCEMVMTFDRLSDSEMKGDQPETKKK